MLTDSPSDTLFSGATIPVTGDTVAHVAGITGRSSPAPEWWGRRPRRSFGTSEERPSSPATTDGESHIKAPPSTSEVVRPSEVGRGRLHSRRALPRPLAPRCRWLLSQLTGPPRGFDAHSPVSRRVVRGEGTRGYYTIRDERLIEASMTIRQVLLDTLDEDQNFGLEA
jgi:hypothetical protein